MISAHLETVIHGGERYRSCHFLIQLECVGGGKRKRKRDGVVDTCWFGDRRYGGDLQ